VTGGRAEQALIQEIKERKAELLVVGLPLGPNGERTPQCESVESFVRRLSKRTSIKVAFVDESFSNVKRYASVLFLDWIVDFIDQTWNDMI
jgi:putative transcription antitermination factor YqgF